MSNQRPKHYQSVQQHYPQYIRAIESLGQQCKELGPLDSKQAHLLQLAAAAARGLEGAVHSHCRQALNAGASPEEIHHCLIILTTTLGFPAVMAAMSWVNDILPSQD